MCLSVYTSLATRVSTKSSRFQSCLGKTPAASSVLHATADGWCQQPESCSSSVLPSGITAHLSVFSIVALLTSSNPALG